jgi:cellulose synthase/poly-beta-1,6-N-acetylglucosamine synthase-like glycosyltransferase
MKRIGARTIFWGSALALIHTHLTYPLSLALLKRLRPQRPQLPGPRSAAVEAESPALPSVSLVIAAHDEEQVIERKLANALAIDYPRDRLELIVASDGSSDGTVERARSAGADLVLDLERGGKLAAQNAAVVRAGGELLAFSDANAYWEPDALRELISPFADPDVGYVCGQVAFLDAEGDNQEGTYWRYEMWVRELESGQAGVTAGNGGIYAVRRSAYRFLPPSRSHDLSFPFQLAKAGFRSLYAPEARAEEKLVPDSSGEFERKRRMMRGLWDIVVGDGMLDPRGYPPLYAYEVFSHRLLRYGSPKLHALLLGANLRLLGRSRLYALTLLAQLILFSTALLPSAPASRPLRLARHYALLTASIAFGTLDRFREGEPAGWEKSEGTR